MKSVCKYILFLSGNGMWISGRNCLAHYWTSQTVRKFLTLPKFVTNLKTISWKIFCRDTTSCVAISSVELEIVWMSVTLNVWMSVLHECLNACCVMNNKCPMSVTLMFECVLLHWMFGCTLLLFACDNNQESNCNKRKFCTVK